MACLSHSSSGTQSGARRQGTGRCERPQMDAAGPLCPRSPSAGYRASCKRREVVSVFSAQQLSQRGRTKPTSRFCLSPRLIQTPHAVFRGARAAMPADRSPDASGGRMHGRAVWHLPDRTAVASWAVSCVSRRSRSAPVRMGLRHAWIWRLHATLHSADVLVGFKQTQPASFVYYIT